MSRKNWLVAVSMLGIISYFSLSAYALELSIWMQPGSGTKTLVRTNVLESTSDKFCDKHTEYENEYTTLLGQRLFSKRVPVDACWYATSYGLIGFNAPNSRVYVKYANRSDAVVRLTDNTYGLSLGQTNAMAFSYYMNSYSRMLYIYDDITSRLALSKNGSYDQYVLDRSYNPWKLQYANGTLVGTNKFDSSQNGEWMIIEGGAGFIRLNVMTKEILTFDQAMYGYGYGADPTHELAISNDGRYAIVAGGPINSKVAYIYDLSTCAPKADRFVVATGCGKRNFKADFFPELSANQAPFQLVFSIDSESISANLANGAGSQDKYIITASGRPEHYLEYLALGDSYTSGEGEYEGSIFYLKGTNGDGREIANFTSSLSNFPYESEKCHISTRSYPYLLASISNSISSQFSTLACSGSDTNDLLNIVSLGNVKDRYNGRYEQYTSYQASKDLITSKALATNALVPGRAAQIEFITKYKPKVVTLGIGGNDINFSSKLEECLNVGTCSIENNLRHYTGLEIHSLYAKFKDAYQKLEAAGPTTRFYVVGYPQILSSDDTCAINVRLNFEERILARNIIGYLNDVIQSAAESAGFTYLDIENSLAGDQLCDESYDGKAVQGIAWGDDIFKEFKLANNTYYITLGNESFHPTHIGHQMMASAISAQLGEKSIVEYRKCAVLDGLRCPSGNNTAPPIPSYFTANGSATNTEYVVDAKSFDSIYVVDNKAGLSQGITVNVQQPVGNDQQEIKLAPGQSVQVTMYSTPRPVGTLTTDVNGNISGSITIPDDAAPGIHTLVIDAKDSLYRNMTMYQQIFVYATIQDFDGDGVPNSNEKCGPVDPVNQDLDRDGIDDACDGIISATPDTTPPRVTATLTMQPNSAGWYKDDVNISWNITDDVDTDLVAPKSVIAGEEGEHTYFSDEVCDTAGNCAKGSITIKLDKTPPLIQPELNNIPNQNGWLNQDVVISWNASDNLSTVSAPTQTIASREGENRYDSDVICDDAGNCTKGSMIIKIDKTSPVVTSLSFSKNPKAISDLSTVTANSSDTNSIVRAEYFIGETGNIGHDATMQLSGMQASTTFGTDFSTGVYKISVRTQDIAGNWSQPASDYLVVYDPSTGLRVHGARTVSISRPDNLLPWTSGQPDIYGKFAFSVRYGSEAKIVPQSDFQFAYTVGIQCATKNSSCKKVELNATRLNWLTSTGVNNEIGMFSGVGILKSASEEREVSFVVSVRDGQRAGITNNDSFAMSIYNGEIPYTSPLLYFVLPTEVGRGNITVKY